MPALNFQTDQNLILMLLSLLKVLANSQHKLRGIFLVRKLQVAFCSQHLFSKVMSSSLGIIRATIVTHLYIAMKDTSLCLLTCQPFPPLQKQCIFCGCAEIYIQQFTYLNYFYFVKIKMKLRVAIECEGMCWSKLQDLKILLQQDWMDTDTSIRIISFLVLSRCQFMLKTLVVA